VIVVEVGGIEVRGTFVAGKLQTTTPRSAEYDVCIHCIGEDTHLGIIAIARLDGTPLGGDETTDYVLTDQHGNICKWLRKANHSLTDAVDTAETLLAGFHCLQLEDRCAWVAVAESDAQLLGALRAQANVRPGVNQSSRTCNRWPACQGT
jgi:hypothetical protein